MEFQFCKIRMFWKSVCDLGNTQCSLTRHFKTIKTGVVEMARWVKEKKKNVYEPEFRRPEPT